MLCTALFLYYTCSFKNQIDITSFPCQELVIPSTPSAPCTDWVDIGVDGSHQDRLCGTQFPEYTGSVVDVNFRSTRPAAKGFLFKFAGIETSFLQLYNFE